MKVVKNNAKTKEEALDLVLKELNAKLEEVEYSFKEIKGGLFKGTNIECTGFLKNEIINEASNYLKNILTGMGLKVNLEISTKEDTTSIKIYSSNNSIIIGRNGQNLEALTTIIRQYIKNFTSNGPKIILDVENYKEKRIKRIEKLAKNLAHDCVATKTNIEMDNMNSYERRIVHNVLTDFKGVTTESVGEEPNRHVVIKYNQ